jgi:Uma2 family endonuclease
MFKPNENRYYTPEEYFALDEASKERLEYYDGYIVVMKGSKLSHNTAALNTASFLRYAFKGKDCRVFMADAKLAIGENRHYIYPDVMAICGEIIESPNIKEAVTNPTFVVEILSDSTKGKDFSEKFDLYSQIPSLQEYLLVRQTEPFVLFYHKLEENKWLVEIFNNLNQTLKLESIDVELPLTEIYENDKFPEPKKSRKNKS